MERLLQKLVISYSDQCCNFFRSSRNVMKNTISQVMCYHCVVNKTIIYRDQVLCSITCFLHAAHIKIDIKMFLSKSKWQILKEIM